MLWQCQNVSQVGATIAYPYFVLNYHKYKRKTWKGNMIKNMLTRRKASDTYLDTVSRHRWSRQITMKIDKNCSFQPALWL